MKKAFEDSVVVVAIFPGPEVSDVAPAAELGRPGLPRALNRIIDLDRKENRLFTLSFFFQGGFYLG